MKDSGAVSQQQVDTQKATADQLEGTVRNDQALVDNAKLNLTYCHITAPESGRDRTAAGGSGKHRACHGREPAAGDYAAAADHRDLYHCPKTSCKPWRSTCKKGTLPVDAYSRDDQTKLASGTLHDHRQSKLTRPPAPDKLKAIFDNKGNELWPNQFVNIHLLLETRKNAIVMPSAAVQRGPQGSFVYLVKPDKTVTVRPGECRR